MFFKKKAFTLIELIIIVAIISLLTGGTVAVYTNYSRAVKLETATDNFIDSLYLARKKARAADTSQCPPGENVYAYGVEKSSNNTDYQIIPRCSSGTPIPISKTLDNGVEFKSFTVLPAPPLEFNILTAFSLSSPSACIILGFPNNDKDCRYVEVSAEGVISSGKLSKCSDSCP